MGPTSHLEGSSRHFPVRLACGDHTSTCPTPGASPRWLDRRARRCQLAWEDVARGGAPRRWTPAPIARGNPRPSTVKKRRFRALPGGSLSVDARDPRCHRPRSASVPTPPIAPLSRQGRAPGIHMLQHIPGGGGSPGGAGTGRLCGGGGLGPHTDARHSIALVEGRLIKVCGIRSLPHVTGL